MKHVSYIPGVCNIGPAEAKVRMLSGYVGLILTVLLEIVFIATSAPAWLHLTLFLPATLAAIGYLQATLHFCVNFGMRGLFNFGDDMARQESVEQLEYRRKDQQKAVQIIVGSMLIGAVVAVICFLYA